MVKYLMITHFMGEIIRLLSSKNHNPSELRGDAVDMSEGEYVAFLDADDYWYGPKMEAQLALMEQTKAVLSSTARELLKSDGTETGHIIPIMDKITYKDLLKHNSLSCSAVIAKREVLLEFPMEHEDSHEDYITWLKIVKKYGFEIEIALAKQNTRISRRRPIVSIKSKNFSHSDVK